MAAVKPEVDIIHALYEIDMKFQRISHRFQDRLRDCRCGYCQQITVTPEIQYGGCETGNSYNSGVVSHRYAVPKAKTFVSKTANKTVHAAIAGTTKQHWKSSMAAVKPEVIITQAVYEIGMKFQRVSVPFQNVVRNRTCGHCQKIAAAQEIQYGGFEIGNSYNSGVVSDRYAVPTAETFVSTTANKTVHPNIVSNTRLHRKSSVPAVKPETVIITSIYRIYMQFQRVRRFLEDGPNTVHGAIASSMPAHHKSNMTAVKPEIVINQALDEIEMKF